MPTEKRRLGQTCDALGGGQVTVHDLPTTIDSDTLEVIGYRASVTRLVGELVQEAAAGGETELHFRPEDLPPVGPSGPVSLEPRRALRERRMTGAQVAEKLNVKPPVISR